MVRFQLQGFQTRRGVCVCVCVWVWVDPGSVKCRLGSVRVCGAEEARDSRAHAAYPAQNRLCSVIVYYYRISYAIVYIIIFHVLV